MGTVDGLGVVSTGHTHTCVGVSAGSRRPLSCVWSRSLAGGRVGDGWQTEGEEEEEEGGEERWEGGFFFSFEMFAMAENEPNL